MNFEKESFKFGHFENGFYRNFRFRDEFLKNKKAKKHIKKLLDIAEQEVDKEIDKRYHEAKKNVSDRIKCFRKIVKD